MGTTIDLTGMIRQIVTAKNIENDLKARKKLYSVILDECNTYADVERLDKEGVLTLEGICDLLMNFDTVIDDYSEAVKRLEEMVNSLLTTPHAQVKKHVLL